MSLRLKIVAIFNKNMKYLQRLNWPELSRYCGCCPLSVGISIRCFLSLVRIMATVTYSVYILTRVFNTKWALHSVSIILVSQEENITLTDDDLLFIHDTMISLIVYEIMWITLKFLHVWAVLATMFSICCKKPRLLQVAFYIILPNWMLDILNMVSSKFFLNPVFQVIFLVDICYDGYNLMAINSLYKQMSRKSRIVPGDDLNNQDSSPETPTTTVTPFAETTLYQCVTCYNSVPLEHRSDVVNIPQVNIPIETPEDTNNDAADNTQENNEEKILNFKDGPIIFNQEQLEGEHS